MLASRRPCGARAWAVLLLLANPMIVQAQIAGSQLTVDQLQYRIEAVEGATDLDVQDRARLVNLYRQSINNLESARIFAQASEDYRASKSTAPREAERIRAAMAEPPEPGPLASVTVTEATPVALLARKLDEQLANQTAAEARLAGLEAQLEAASSRLVEARTRISAVRSQIVYLSGEGGGQILADQPTQLADAQRWARETRLYALQAELLMLDRELLSHDARFELLDAQRDQQAQVLQQIVADIRPLSTLIVERRRQEADRAIAEAQAVLRTTRVDEPLFTQLAEDNLRLIERLRSQLNEIDSLLQMFAGLPATAELDAANWPAWRYSRPFPRMAGLGSSNSEASPMTRA
mgnify:FL=1